MDMTINREALLAAMTPLSALLGKHPSLLFSVAQDKLQVTAGGEQVELKTETLCQVRAAGTAIFKGRSLFDFVRSLNDGQQINFKQEGDFTRLLTGRSNYRFANLPLDSYANYKHVGSTKVVADFTMTGEQIKNLLGPVIHAVGHQDVRPWVNGILFDLSEEALVVVATNGHCMAINQIAHGGKIEKPGKYIVHGDAIAEIIKLTTGSATANSRFRFTESAVRVDAPSAAYKTLLVAGVFADYRQVIPHHDTSVDTNAKELAEAVTRACILSDKHRSVRLDVDQGSVQVTAKNEEEGAKEEVGATTNMHKADIAFNADYIISSLKAIESETANIAMNNRNSAVLIRDMAKPHLLQVVMPLRT